MAERDVELYVFKVRCRFPDPATRKLRTIVGEEELEDRLFAFETDDVSICLARIRYAYKDEIVPTSFEPYLPEPVVFPFPPPVHPVETTQ